MTDIKENKICRDIKCDMCTFELEPAKFEGKTIFRTHAYMCRYCFIYFGVKGARRLVQEVQS